MKCTAIKLSSRFEQKPTRRSRKENTSPAFKGDGGHSYSFPFVRPKTDKSTTIAVTTINPPDNIKCFNTGSSLDRWSQKRVRWKSAKISKTPTEFDKDFCYETLETDLSILLNEDEDCQSRDASLDNLQYEVHTDIEKLLQESQRTGEEEEEVKDEKKRRKKKKKSKTVKLSKPPTPQTEQVIRVDVTSNVSNEAKMKKNEDSEETEDKRIDLKRNLYENGPEMCDEEFIIKCRQLALRQRRRRRL